jgi:hypothetical protein
MRRFKNFTFLFDEPANPTPAPEPTAPASNPEPETTPAPAPAAKYTDEDLDRIIGQKFKKWQKQQEEAVSEAARLAQMTAQERAEAERDKLQKELNELRAANARADMEKQARQILNADGISIPDELLTTLVRDDAETTSAAVKAFSASYKSAVQAGITATLSHKTPPAGAGAGTITKEDIMKEPDRRKRQDLIKKNMNLFK